MSVYKVNATVWPYTKSMSDARKGNCTILAKQAQQDMLSVNLSVVLDLLPMQKSLTAISA